MLLAFGYSRRYNTGPFVTMSTKPRPDRAWIDVDLTRLAANAQMVRAKAVGARLLPMIKADGYGLGAVPVARELERAVDPWGFGVATINEGAILRAAGIRRPIVVFTPARRDQLAGYRAHDLRAVLDDPSLTRDWDLPFHLEIDTGMGRSGVRWDDAHVADCRGAALEGAFFHFHSAEDAPETVTQQAARFQSALAVLGERPRFLHAANSAAIWHFETVLDLVRPGILLYGCRPAPDIPEPASVATLRSRVVSLRRIPAGESVSYGAEWRARQDTIVATVGFGYADGMTRTVQGKARLIINGRLFPVVGRITMDMILADLGPDGAGVRVGDVVTLVGRDGQASISWEDLAGWAGTNTYEMLCRTGQRVERRYTTGGMD
jgi:alanine racemase